MKTNLLKDNFPELVKEWDFEKNKENVEDITIGSHLKAFWICKENHSYPSMVYHRTKGRGCPYCSSKKILVGFNDLKTTHPEIAEEYDEEKNELKATEIFPSSEKTVWWKCKNNHSYPTTPAKRTVLGRGCPYCSNQKVLAGFNDLKTTHPEIAEEWSEKNSLLPTEVTHGTAKKIIWKCKNNHEYEMSVNHRTNEKGCPVCANKLIIEGINDFASQNPERLQDWDYSKNKILPTQISSGSKKRIFWKCHVCEKEWSSVLHTAKNNGCPRCKESKGEKRISDFLEKNGIKYKSQYRFDDCRNKNPLPFDFAIFDKNNNLILLIEYDGIQHFKTLNFDKPQELLDKILEEIKERDKIKTNYCKNNNINLLRISYLDFDNIEKILYDNLF